MRPSFWFLLFIWWRLFWRSLAEFQSKCSSRNDHTAPYRSNSSRLVFCNSGHFCFPASLHQACADSFKGLKLCFMKYIFHFHSLCLLNDRLQFVQRGIWDGMGWGGGRTLALRLQTDVWCPSSHWTREQEWVAAGLDGEGSGKHPWVPASLNWEGLY